MLLAAVGALLAPTLHAQTPAPNLDRVEYFIDADPGHGLATAVTLTGAPSATRGGLNFPISLSALPAGFHTLSVRSRAGTNNWSQTARQLFYKEPATSTAAAPALAGAEYFIDADPGYGAGTAVAITGGGTNAAGVAFTASLGSVTPGFHSLSVRSRDVSGRWSQTYRQIFYKEPATSTAATPALAGAEYFIDADPGYGAGTAVAITGGGTNAAGVAFTASLGSVTPGFHSLSVRSRDVSGRWSQTYRQIFYKEPATATAAPANLAALEYFVDTDPGHGAGTAVAITGGGINATGVSFAVGLGALPVGFHTLFYRVRDVANKWSQTQSRLFYVDGPGLAAAPNLNKAEYYVDTDPGYGSATNVPIATPATTLAALNMVADLSGLSDGPHRLFVRVRDATNRWSQVLNRSFTKSGCASSENYAAGRPVASYGSNAFAGTTIEQIFNGSVVPANTGAFFNTYYAQVDLGTALRPISEVQLHLQNVNGTTVNYTLEVETSTDLSTWNIIDSYSATLAANQTAPVLVKRTFATVRNNVRGLRLRLLLPTISQGIQLTNAGVFYFNCVGPVITDFTPKTGPAGTLVTITGTGLGGASLVRFNGTAAGTITNNTATSLTVAAPAGGSNGSICVTTAAGTACSTASYTYPPAIATGTISPTAFCAGNTITVPFSTNTADFGAGNTYGLQLSNASGAFAANAPVFGTLSGAVSANGGTLVGTLPLTTPAGTGYRVRVVASNPAVTGANNGANLTINTTPVSQATGPASVANGAPINLSVTPTITGATYAWSGPGFSSSQQSPTTSTTTPGVARYSVNVTLGSCSFSSFVDVTVQPSTDPILTMTTFAGPVCLAAPRSISFSVAGNPFPSGNTLTAQLSSATGVFTTPVTIGSVSFSGLGNGSLTATVPSGTALGTGYRIRLVGSNPSTIVSNNNGSNITLNAPPAPTAGSNSPVPEGGTISLLGGPAATGNSYTWTVQYTNGGSSGVFSTAQNPQLANATPAMSGTYTLTVTNAAGCSAAATVPVTVTPAAPVTTLALTALAGPLCAGSSYTLNYTASGPDFNAGNTISAVLSNVGGNFPAGNPVIIGTRSATAAAAGTLSVTIPAGTAAGSGYRIRLVSSNPAITSNNNGSALTITNLSGASAGSNSPVATGSPISLSATGITGATYAWSGPNNFSASGPNQTISGATATNAGTYSVLITLNGCTTTASTTVVVNAPAAVASVQTSAINGSFCAGNPISVPFTAANFTAGNVFTAQLSNASGAFGSPVAIGTLAGTGGGTIAATLPAATLAGSGYRIRVVGSQPTTSGPDNGSDLTVTAAGVYTWLGTANNNWFEPANWSCGLVPISTSVVMIPAGRNTYPVLGAGTPTVLHLTVASGATLTINGTLSLRGDLTSNGTVNATASTLLCEGTTAQTLGGSRGLRVANLTVNNPAGVTLQTALGVQQRLLLTAGNLASGGNLTLESDATGTAMVVNPVGGGIVTGAATARRYVDGSLNPGRGYRHFASPVTGAGATVAALRGPGAPPPTVNLAYNTANNPAAVTPYPTVFTFDEQRLTATSGTFDRGWQSPALTDALEPGRGYTVNLAPTTLSLTGTLHNGNQTVALTTGGLASSGWHLLGNPYPAPLNWNNLALPVGMDNALYVFRSSGPYAGSYVSYVNGIGPDGANLVASGQGFFGRVSSGAPTLTFTNAARETAYVNPVQYRTTDSRPLLELALQAAGGKGLSDVFFVYRQTGATSGFDSRLDALKVVLNTGLQPTLYHQAGAQNLSIQGLPDDEQSQVLPLGVFAPAAGSFVFRPQRLVNFPANTTLVLEDRQNGSWHNLRTGPYTAELAKGLTATRFVLHLNVQRPLATTAGNQPFTELQVYPSPTTLGSAVQVVLLGPPTALSRTQLDVLNSIGQRVYGAAGPSAAPATGSLRLVVPTAGLATGVYTVRLTTAHGVLTRRIILN